MARNASVYTTRIQKGGALLNEMRQLVRFWYDGPVQELASRAVRSNVLNKATRARAGDILKRTFVPRFIDGQPRNAWKLVRPLENCNAGSQLIRPVYYWITAKSEPLLYDFCEDYLLRHIDRARNGVSLADVKGWLAEKGCSWSPTVSTKVARGLLAAFRDFGILQGRSEKRLASYRLPVGAFAYIAFCLHQSGVLGRNLVSHPDWRLFFLQTTEIEHYFLESHQSQLIEYHAAGSMVRISFPCGSLEDYARVVVERSN